MRFKLFVFLRQLKVAVVLHSKSCTPNSPRANRLKPDGDIRVVLPLAGRHLVRCSDLARHCNLLRLGERVSPPCNDETDGSYNQMR
jgi:hypothetical protein